MAKTRGIRAGQAFVELLLQDRSLTRGLRAAQRRLKAFGAGVARIGAGVSAIATAAFAPLGISAIKAAAQAEESFTRFRQVFGAEAAAAGRFAEDLADKVGRSAVSVRDGMGVFQSFFVGLGFGGSQARKLSQDLSGLLLDFASFNNISDEEALQRFISALSGSSEVLDRFGINVRQAALQQELLRMGISRSWDDITEQEKALARVNIIMRAMGDQGAIGDAVRTSGSWTNQLKRLNGELLDMRVAIGDALIPVLLPFLRTTIQVVETIRRWIQENPRLAATIFGVGAGAIALGGALVGLGVALSVTGMALGGIASVAGVAAGALAFLVSPIGAVVGMATLLGTTVVQYSDMSGRAIRWLMDRFGELRSWVTDVVGGITDALAAGQPALAAKVLWLSLKVIWEEGATALTEIWNGLWAGALASAEFVLHALEVAWIEMTSFFEKLWANMWDGLVSYAEQLIAWLGKKIVALDGLITGTDTSELQQAIEDDLQLRLAGIGQGNEQRNAAIEQERRQRREDAAAIHEGTLMEIARSLDAATSGSQADLEAARAALAAAIAEARQARAEAPAIGAPSLADALNGLQDIDVGAIADRISVRGTFSSAAVQGLAAGGGVAERTATATEETAKNTRRIVDKILQTGGTMRFA